MIQLYLNIIKRIRKMNILIVDDNQVVRHLLNNTVKGYCKLQKCSDFNIFEAQDGIFAMEMMESKKIDLVLLDCNMPRMNGEKVVESIRLNDNWQRTRIVIATALGTEENVLKMIKKGANGYIVKPFNQRTVFKTLDAIMTNIKET